MHDLDIAKRWSEIPDMNILMGRWSWFKESAISSLTSTASKYGLSIELSSTDLACSFFSWAQLMESAESHRVAHPQDYVHYISGALLESLLGSGAIKVDQLASNENSSQGTKHSLTRWPEGFLLLSLALIFLSAQKFQLNMPQTILNIDLIDRNWNSFKENTQHDKHAAIPFFYLFCGLQPNWQNAGPLSFR